MSYNKILLMGNLTRDPELRYTAGGKAVCSLGLAVDKKYKTANGEEREEVLFIDVTAWGNQADSCNNYLKKGAQIFVEGSLRLESWVDKTTGQNRSKHTVSADRVQFLGAQQTQANPSQQPSQSFEPPPMSGFDGQMSL